MSLPVPLTVRIGDRHVTQAAEGLSFRREAVGGVRSLSFNLRTSTNTVPDYLQPLASVDIFDGRTGEIVAQGRVADTGRGTGDDGQSWEVVAFGPAQAASDVSSPKIWIDRRVSEGWRQVLSGWSGGATWRAGLGGHPDTDAAGILAHFPNESSLSSGDYAAFVYDPISSAGGKLAAVHASWDGGSAVVGCETRVTTGVAGALTNDAYSASLSTAGGTISVEVGTDFPNGDGTAALRIVYVGGGGRLTSDDAWSFWDSVIVESVRTVKDGSEITSGYTGATNTGSIVHDLLGCGFLPEFDGDSSEVTLGATNVTQLAYPEGVTAAQVLDDLMAIEPSSRWYTEPDRTGNGYVFRWETLPTTVRYEATIEDGGSFPMTTQGLYNYVAVTWVDVNGLAHSTVRTSACEILDSAGVDRKATVAMPTEAGATEAAAESFGDNFLAEHNVPKNGGTLSVARPIRDLQTGRMVEPFEIEAGELIRVVGVESYPDALNADSNDGESVFRIFAMDYTADDNRASLSLDADPKTTSAALAKLLTQRTRR